MDPFPPIARVRQSIPQPVVADVAGDSPPPDPREPAPRAGPAGGTIAVGVGSRGITAIARIARADRRHAEGDGLQAVHRRRDGEPRRRDRRGPARAAGRLRRHARGDGRRGPHRHGHRRPRHQPVGLPIYFDKNAYEADGIVLLNRVKPHTDFHATYESGVLKMLVIGLGKRDGAEPGPQARPARAEGGPAGGRQVPGREHASSRSAWRSSRTPTTCPPRSSPVEPETIFDVEPQLLDRARALMGRLPFDQIDVLIVGELGKNYSGAGMDPNVIGRLMVETQPDFDRPVVTRLAVLDVSDESHGNIVGVGFADLTTERLVVEAGPRAVPDQRPDLVLPGAGPDPDHPADRPRRLRGLRSTPAGGSTRREARLVVIPNTLELNTLWVSPALEDEVRAHPHLTRETDYLPIPFSADGTLDQEVALPRERPRPTAGRGAYATH